MNLIPQKIALMAQGDVMNPSYRINIHFHPDLPYKDITVIESLASSKQYQSQFKTGVSNGGLLTTSGRTQWEKDLFGGHYALHTAATNDEVERPKYGALNITGDFYGSAPRFGSCYFRLRPEVLQRSTFCFPDSSNGLRAAGTAAHFSLDSLAQSTYVDDPLNQYVEAHVHGPLNIPEDVEVLVLDPSYKDTFIQKAAESLCCGLEWHQGYRVIAADLLKHTSYRGGEFVEIAMQLADGTGRLSPQIVGEAYRAGIYSQQELKKVWHYTARYGRVW